MRPLLLALATLTLAQMQGQFFERVDQQDMYSKFMDIEQLPNGHFIAVDNVTLNGSSTHSTLVELDDSGNRISETIIEVVGNDHTEMQWVDMLPNGNFLVVGNTMEACDFGLQQAHMRVYNGMELIIEQPLELPSASSMASNDTLIAITSSNALILLDHDGNELDRYPLPIEGYKNVGFTTSGLVVWGSQGVALLDDAGNFAHTLSGVIVNEVTEMPDGRILCFSVSALQILDNELQPTGIEVPIAGGAPRRILVSESAVIAHTQDELLLFDLQLVPLSAVPIPHENNWYTIAVALQDTMVTLVGIAITRECVASSIRNLSVAGGADTVRNDVRLVNSEMDSTLLSITTLSATTIRVSGSVWISTYVVNEGDETLLKTSINYYFPYGTCGPMGQTFELDSLSIPPGDSALVQFGPIYFLQYMDTNVTSDLSICVFAASPNDRLDRDVTNNESCATLFIPLGMEDVAIPTFTLAPNPASTLLTLDLGAALASNGTLDVHDATGRKVHSMTLATGTTRFSVLVHELGSGLYVLTVHGDGSSASSRFIVE